MMHKKLMEISNINPHVSESPDSAALVSFLTMANVNADGTTSLGEDRRYSETRTGYTQFRDQDILVAKITPCFENGKIAQARIRHEFGAGSTEFHVVRPDPAEVDASYLTSFLRQRWVRVAGEQRMTGSAGQRRVPASFLASLKVPVPSLPEQRRIVGMLKRADALRAKRREALADLDDLAQSIFSDTFGNVATNERLWDESELLSEVADVTSGITKGRTVGQAATRSVPYLAVANVQDMRLDLGLVKTIDATETEIDRYRLQTNDLLLTEGGDPDKLGRGVLWRGEIPECIHQNHIFRVRLKKDSKISPVFLNWLVSSPRGRSYFLRCAKQTTGIASINATQLRNFPLLVPPTEVQERFTAALSKIDQQRRSQRAHLVELNSLFEVLQYRAFRGEL